MLVNMCMQVYVQMCIHVYVYTCKCACMYTNTCTHTVVRWHLQGHYPTTINSTTIQHIVRVHMRVCIYIHAHLHVSTAAMNSKNTRRITGWRRHIRCLKLQVIFRKRATNYRALLWKMTCEDKASYASLPPWSSKRVVWIFFYKCSCSCIHTYHRVAGSIFLLVADMCITATYCNTLQHTATRTTE